MQLGMIGLGRMGANMVRRLINGDHECVVFDLSPEAVKALEAMGHTVNAAEPTWGNLQTVQWDRRTNTLSGGSDPRNPVGKAAVQLSDTKGK